MDKCAFFHFGSLLLLADDRSSFLRPGLRRGDWVYRVADGICQCLDHFIYFGNTIASITPWAGWPAVKDRMKDEVEFDLTRGGLSWAR